MLQPFRTHREQGISAAPENQMTARRTPHAAHPQLPPSQQGPPFRHARRHLVPAKVTKIPVPSLHCCS